MHRKQNVELKEKEKKSDESEEMKQRVKRLFFCSVCTKNYY